jgi:hypothetical protein
MKPETITEIDRFVRRSGEDLHVFPVPRSPRSPRCPSVRSSGRRARSPGRPTSTGSSTRSAWTRRAGRTPSSPLPRYRGAGPRRTRRRRRFASTGRSGRLLESYPSVEASRVHRIRRSWATR